MKIGYCIMSVWRIIDEMTVLILIRFKPVYTADEVNAIQVVRHPRVDMSDKVASAMVAFARCVKVNLPLFFLD